MIGCWLSWRCATRGSCTETTETELHTNTHRTRVIITLVTALKVKFRGQRSEVRGHEVGLLPGVVKLLSMLDPSQDSTALSTDGSVLNALWLDIGATMTTGSSSPSWCSMPSPAPGPRPGPITQDFGLVTKYRKSFLINCSETDTGIRNGYGSESTDGSGNTLRRTSPYKEYISVYKVCIKCI